MNPTTTPRVYRVTTAGLQPCDHSGEAVSQAVGSPVVVFARGRHTAWKFWDFPPVPAQALAGLVATQLEAESLVDITELAWACESLTPSSTTTRRVSVCVVPGKTLSDWRSGCVGDETATLTFLPLAAACARALSTTADWQLVTWIDANEAEFWLVTEGRVWAATIQRSTTGAWSLAALEEAADRFVQAYSTNGEPCSISRWSILHSDPASVAGATNSSERLACPLTMQSQTEFDWRLADLVRRDCAQRPAQRRLPVIRTPSDPLPVNHWRTQPRWVWRAGIAAAVLVLCLLTTSLVNARISEQQIGRVRQQLSQTESLNTRLRAETALAGDVQMWLAGRVIWSSEFRRLSEIAESADGCQIQAVHTQMGSGETGPSLRIQGTADTSEAVVALQQQFLEEVPEYQLVPYGIRPRNQRGESGVQFEFELIRRLEADIPFEDVERKETP